MLDKPGPKRIGRKLVRLYELVDRSLPNPLPGFDRPPIALASLRPVALTLVEQEPLHMPFVSIVISTLNRADYLGRTLQSLLQLRYPHFEVIVVEGPSTDETAAVLDRWGSRIKRATCNVRNLSTSRNIGIRAAAGSVLAFIDDDAVPEPDWLDRLVEPFKDSTVGATGGAIRNWTGWRFQCRALKVDIGARVRRTTAEELETGTSCPAFTGTNFCVRRDAAVAAGMFDEAYAYFLEESDLQQILFQSGMALVYVDKAEVHHLRAPNAHRDSDRLPADYNAKLCSVAYFCMKHRMETDDRTEVLLRMTRQLDVTVTELRRFMRKDRIAAPAAAQRVRSAYSGLRRGIKLYGDRLVSRGAKTAPPAGATPRFQPFNADLSRVPRVAVICRGAGQHEGLASAIAFVEALAQTQCELTLIMTGTDNTVEYRGSYWAHCRRRGKIVGARRAPGMNTPLAIRELKRVDLNRGFEAVVDLNYSRSLLSLSIFPWPQYREKATRALLLRPKGKPAPVEKIKPEDLSARVGDVSAACLRLSLESRSAPAAERLAPAVRPRPKLSSPFSRASRPGSK